VRNMQDKPLLKTHFYLNGRGRGGAVGGVPGKKAPELFLKDGHGQRKRKKEKKLVKDEVAYGGFWIREGHPARTSAGGIVRRRCRWREKEEPTINLLENGSLCPAPEGTPWQEGGGWGAKSDLHDLHQR